MEVHKPLLQNSKFDEWGYSVLLFPIRVPLLPGSYDRHICLELLFSLGFF